MYNQASLKEIVDRAMLNIPYGTDNLKLADPVKYVLSIGGKRLRPVITLMCCNIFNDKIDDAVLPAAGIEVFHNFTLVHDDIMDQSSLRRNFPTVHSKWNTNQAILSGDVMAFIANECFLQSPSGRLIKIFRVFNKAAIEVCMGQQMDMDYEKSAIISQKEYLQMIELKTAVLIAASAKIGAIAGGSDDRDSELLYGFGKNLGLAFQIQDDYLDIWGDSKVFGKKAGGDIIAGKKTLPFVIAMESASGDNLKQLRELFSGRNIDPEVKIRKVMDLYEILGIREKTEAVSKNFIDKALALTDELSVDEKRKKELVCLASSLIGRDR